VHGPHVCLVKEDKVLKQGKIEFSKKKNRKTFRSLRRKERGTRRGKMLVKLLVVSLIMCVRRAA
jgi:hypothetical protein